MSRVFGEIAQIAYITRRFDETLKFFLQTGIGPWYVAKNRMMKDVDYLGTRVDIEMSVGVANSGSLQLEVIEPTNGVRSVYTDWLDRHPTELFVQHVSSWPVDYPATEKRVLEAGFKPIMTGRLSAGPFGYYIHPDKPEFIFEMSELSAARRYVWETVARGAADWDGKDPYRAWPVLSKTGSATVA